MSKYKGLFTFDVDNHRYIPVEQADVLNKVWEDVEEPLIKDEKIRKAVRAWAEASGLPNGALISAYIDGLTLMLKHEDISISIWLSLLELDDFDLAHDRQFYTIADLCGEE